MAATAVLPSVRTLPLPDEAQELFSRAVLLVTGTPGEFAPVGEWLDKHYSEATLQALCERRYRHDFAYRLHLLRRDGTGNFAISTHKRRLALQRGQSREALMWATIHEAHARGYRLNGPQLVGRCQPDQYPDEKMVDETNYETAWRSEDEQYRRQFRKIKAERRAAKLDENDHPEKPTWRLARAVGELIEAEYPDPPEHAEHSRRIVGVAALLVCADPPPALGEFGRWAWESKPDMTWEADPANPRDDFWRWLSQPPAQDGPHKTPLHIMHARHEGREEVLFQRMPGEPRELQRQWGDLSSFCKLLRVAVEELEQRTPTVRPDSSYAAELSAAGAALAQQQQNYEAGLERVSQLIESVTPIAETIKVTYLEAVAEREQPKTTGPLAQPASTVTPERQQPRRGRLTKDESGAKRATMLATIRQHQSLKDDPGTLAGMVGVSEMTVRRWLDEEEQKYRASNAANAEQREE